MAKVAVIVPAAGAGERFGGKVKKPFATLDNRPVFIRVLELFVNRPDVCQTILAVGADDFDVVREKYAANLMFMDIKLVSGGAERYASVQAALAEVSPEAELVCVHDAVRPCVLDKWIDAVFARAAETGAALLAAPLTGTIKRTDAEGRVTATVPRERLWEAQTPQVFRVDLLREAYAGLAEDARPTDDAQVVEQAGHAVHVVEADRRNIKITHPADLSLAQSLVKDMGRKPKSGGPRSPFHEAEW